MVVNGAQWASYSQAKESLVGTGYFTDGIFLHFCASMISGFVTTVASMPVDIVKTRLQNMKKTAENRGALVSTLIPLNTRWFQN
jgi:solute carrier family 25 oxoglutarate transporter 11